jgi:predicted transcriptional regulator YheO
VRGAAQRLADILNVSRASIYNYRAVANENQEN